MILTSAMGIRYEEFGTGMPFIALHGYTLDRRMSMGAFEPLFDEQGRAAIPPSAGAGRPSGGLSASGYRRIYPDSPFMGGSCDLAEASSDAMLSAFEAFVREVAPSGPFLLAGESYGGYMARALARSFPGRVAGLFLLCPAIVPSRGDRDIPEPAVLSEEAGWNLGASDEEALEYVDNAVVRCRYGFERTRDEILPGIRLARSAALERLQAESYRLSFDALGRAGSKGEAFDPVFERPACFVLGRQDASVGWRDAFRLADLYPRASFHVVDTAGHNLQIEQAGIFGAAFGTWIGACEKGSR